MLAFVAYTPLVDNFPTQLRGTGGDLGQYVNAVIIFAIGLAGILAVIMIIVGGVQYVSTDSWSGKSDGKNRTMAALGGLLLALASFLILNTIDPNLTTINFKITPEDINRLRSGLPNSGAQLTVTDTVEESYNKVYDRWTEADQVALQNGDNEALNKWTNIQSQIKGLNQQYGSEGPPVNPTNVGTANQKVLKEIASGNARCVTHCFASAEALYKDAGVTRSRAEFQNSGYTVGSKVLPAYGTPRLPVPGEMVDMYTGFDKSDPFHTVIAYSNLGNGKYLVWDWHNNVATGLRTVNFNTTNPGTKGYIGRVYTPQ